MKRLLSYTSIMLIAVCGACWGQIIDPLHGCITGTSCFDNGTVTPTSTNPLPKFTFTVSPGPNTGDFLVEILIPDNATNAASESFTISGTQAGSANTSTIRAIASTSDGLSTMGGVA